MTAGPAGLSRRHFLAAMTAPLAVPARSDVPPAIRDLERRGQVTYVYSDVGKPIDEDARTTFTLQWPFSCEFLHALNLRPGTVEVVVSPRITQVGFSLTHTISLPTRYAGAAFRHDALVRHELDHVAISLDGRVRLILLHLINRVPSIRREVPGTAPPTTAWMQQLVRNEVDRRGQAVVKLIQANYDRLDSKPVSDHGRRALPDRPGFFGGLFTAANLEAEKFEFRDQMGELLQGADYRQSKTVFLD